MAVLLDKPYCTLLDVQKETKSPGAENDDWYRTCINLSSRWIETHCGRGFRYYDHSADPLQVLQGWVLADEIHLPFPIITLTELSVYSNRSDGPDSSDIWDDTDYYTVDHAVSRAVTTGLIKTESGNFGAYPFTEHMQLKGTFGWTAASDEEPPVGIPAGVTRACILAAAAMSGKKSVEQIGLDGSRVELLEQTIPREAKQLLQIHRDIVGVNF